MPGIFVQDFFPSKPVSSIFFLKSPIPPPPPPKKKANGQPQSEQCGSRFESVSCVTKGQQLIYFELWNGEYFVAIFGLACVAWRFCRAGRTSGKAAKFVREARKNERRSHEKNKTACPDSWPFQLPPPSTHFDILLTTCLVSVFPANQK